MTDDVFLILEVLAMSSALSLYILDWLYSTYRMSTLKWIIIGYIGQILIACISASIPRNSLKNEQCTQISMQNVLSNKITHSMYDTALLVTQSYIYTV